MDASEKVPEKVQSPFQIAANIIRMEC